jgi:EAL domain-containing protein (putative c-di-GMP-specific phosphodiesterase class I)
VVAEGVETVAQLEALSQRGCHLIQGFLFARPMSCAMLAEALRNPGFIPASVRPATARGGVALPML